MKDAEFVRIARELTELKPIYFKGEYGRKITKAIYTAKCKQNKWNAEHVKEADAVGKYGCDCVCTIKGILWGWTKTTVPKYGTNGVKDEGADEIFAKRCTKICKPKDAKPGYILHCNGHVGIYIGNGQVVESAPSVGGLRVTKLSYQPWTEAGALEYIEYTESTPTVASTATSSSGVAIGSSVRIKSGAKYGGLTASRGKNVPTKYIGKVFTVNGLATHKGTKEARIKELVSWIDLQYLERG